MTYVLLRYNAWIGGLCALERNWRVALARSDDIPATDTPEPMVAISDPSLKRSTGLFQTIADWRGMLLMNIVCASSSRHVCRCTS